VYKKEAYKEMWKTRPLRITKCTINSWRNSSRQVRLQKYTK